MSEHALAQQQRTNTPQEAARDALSLQYRHTNQAEPTTLPKRLFDVAPGTFAESRFGYDFSRVPAHTDMVRRTQPLLRTRTMVQRYPVSGDADSAPCATCSDEESTQTSASDESTVETSVPAHEAAPTAAPTEPITEQAEPGETPASGFIVEDSATELGPSQMRRSDFIAQLRAEVCRTVETAIAGTGRSTENCPYLDHWFGYYSRQDSAHIERAIRRYSPEASNATTARGYISAVTQRARQSAETWARTGKITGVPEGIPIGLLGTGLMGSLVSGIGSIFFKARKGGAKAADDPQVIQAKLGEGQPLEGSVRLRMESAFGINFSHVRTHTDSTATGLSNRFNARASTVGEHVAFGANEYKPGTLIGDALIAHELAHVIQQEGAGASVTPVQQENVENNAFEEDADRSAIGAMFSLWGRAKGNFRDISKKTVPRLRSGLRLSRCQRDRQTTTEAQSTSTSTAEALSTPTVSIGEVNAPHTPTTAKRIPPRVDTPVSITVSSAGGGSGSSGSSSSESSSANTIALSIEGAGSDNGSATINGSNTHNITGNENVQLRGVGQTEPGNAENLKLVAHQGTNKLAESNGFSVAAYPIEIGFNYHSLLTNYTIPSIPGYVFWGAAYSLTFNSDSGTDGDCDRTKISENLIDAGATGLFAGTTTEQSGFRTTTLPNEGDRHAQGHTSAANLRSAIDNNITSINRSEQHQFFRFACQRSGIAEDRNNSPKVPTSGFKVVRSASRTGGVGGQYFIHVTKEGFANHGVAAGTVDDTTRKDAQI